MGCACYDEGWEDGHDEGIKNRKSTDNAEQMKINYHAVDLLVEKMTRSPWVESRIVDVFDLAGYSLKKITDKSKQKFTRCPNCDATLIENMPPGGEKTTNKNNNLQRR